MSLIRIHGVRRAVFLFGIVIGIYRRGRVRVEVPGKAVYAAMRPCVAEWQIVRARNVAYKAGHCFKASAAAAGEILIAVAVRPVVFADAVRRAEHYMAVHVARLLHHRVQMLNDKCELAAQGVILRVHVASLTVFHVPLVVRAQQNDQIGASHFLGGKRMKISVAASVGVVFHVLVLGGAETHDHVDKPYAAVRMGNDFGTGYTGKLSLPASVGRDAVTDGKNLFACPFAFHYIFHLSNVHFTIY